MGFSQVPPLHVLAQLTFWMSVAFALASVPSVLSSRRGNPLAALSWLFALMLFPGVGALCWWFFGRNALRRRRSRRAAKRAEFLQRIGKPSTIQIPFDRPELKKLAVSAAAQIVPCPDARVRVLCEGPEAFERMGQAISSAHQQINALFYLWSNDETGVDLRNRLCERAKAGVKVRVLLDAIGSMDLHKDFWAPLREAGGRVESFMPPRLWTRRRPSWNFRNHRKILVIDHNIAFSGGMNVANDYAQSWKDVHLQTMGSSAQALEHVFYDDWYYTTGEFIDSEVLTHCPENHGLSPAKVTVLSSGPDSPQPWIHDFYFRAMASAKKRLWLATPYFVPTESICTALRTAAIRGVDVRILVPGNNDRKIVQWAARAYYPGLIAAGVKIYEYAPSMMHAKIWLADQTDSAIGSANFDHRSFHLNFEVTCLLQSDAVVQSLEQWFLKMLADSVEVRQDNLIKSPRWTVVRDALAHLWSPLL